MRTIEATTDGRHDRGRPGTTRNRSLDTADRKILALLAEDATMSYASLGACVGLSAPAVHERVKRLRQAGIIRGTVALVDPGALGRPFTAFVHLDTHSSGRLTALRDIAEMADVEEIHAVAGDACIIVKVRTEGTRAFETLLAALQSIAGIRGARAYVVLSSPLERPPRVVAAEDTDGPGEIAPRPTDEV